MFNVSFRREPGSIPGTGKTVSFALFELVVVLGAWVSGEGTTRAGHSQASHNQASEVFLGVQHRSNMSRLTAYACWSSLIIALMIRMVTELPPCGYGSRSRQPL